jgi:N-acetylglucosaminyldiphosphoundecaprenol N-acetyl-beta-D-mannosaminyltransferase
MLTKHNVLNTLVSSGSYEDFLETITDLPRLKSSAYVCFANVHMLMEAQQDPYFNHVVNSADVVTPDGKPVSLLMNSIYSRKQERVCGMDLFPDILKKATEKKRSVFFYGSSDEVLTYLKTKASSEFPELKITGSYSPPFRALSSEEDQEVIRMINDAKADFIFVSLGCPKQEKWMYAHKDVIHGCMLGLGQAFLTYTGFEKRLPVWARNLSLEWLYRLFLEPKRLWKRYLIGNSKFIFLASKTIFIKKYGLMN